MTTKSRKIKKGDKFQSPYADAIIEWEVKSLKRPGVWLCSSLDEEYYGTKLFTSEEIAQALSRDQLHQKIMDSSDEFYNSLNVAQQAEIWRVVTKCKEILNSDERDPVKLLRTVIAKINETLPTFVTEDSMRYYYKVVGENRKAFYFSVSVQENQHGKIIEEIEKLRLGHGVYRVFRNVYTNRDPTIPGEPVEWNDEGISYSI